jgi:predicted phage-related endonuclease
MPDPERRSLSSTETPAVLGVSPYSTRWMIMQRFAGNEIAKPGDNRMDWGTRMQPLILAAAAAELAIDVEPNTLNLYVRNGGLGATVDAWSTAPDLGKGVVECKCCFDWGTWMRDWGGGKTPPKHVEVQLQHQLAVGDGTTPFKWGMIVCWVGGELHYFRREPVPDLQALLLVEAARFFDDLAAKNYGEPFGTSVEQPLISRLFAPKEGKVLDLREGGDVAMHLAADVVALVQFAEARKFDEKNEKSFKNRIAGAMADAEKLLLPGGVVVEAKRVTRHMKPQPARETQFTSFDYYVPPNAQIDRPPLTGMLKDIIAAG